MDSNVPQEYSSHNLTLPFDSIAINLIENTWLPKHQADLD